MKDNNSFIKKILERIEKTMTTMIMKHEPQFLQTSALETGLGSLCSNYHYGWNRIVDNAPEYNLFAGSLTKFRQLHKIFSGSFHSLFNRAVNIGTGTREL